MNPLTEILKAVFNLSLKAIPFLFHGAVKLAHFLSAQRSIIGMFVTGLVLVFTGQAWAGIILFAKAGFLLFAAAFGVQLATSGVKVTMLPLISTPITPPPDKPANL